MRMPKDVSFRIDSRTGCWICTSHVPATHGYPMGYHNGQQTTLHRKIYIQHTGRDLPSDVFVIHSCDNKMCINPAHLREGTAADNSHDAVIRDRVTYGENHHRAVLTDEAAIQIASSRQPVRLLAERYNVSRGAIYKIKNGVTWRRATGISRR